MDKDMSSESVEFDKFNEEEPEEGSMEGKIPDETLADQQRIDQVA
jgi:hypothetical protein